VNVSVHAAIMLCNVSVHGVIMCMECCAVNVSVHVATI